MEMIAAQAAVASPMSTPDFVVFIDKERERFRDLVKRADASMED